MFGRGTLGDAQDLLGSGYTLLSTPRAARTAPELVARAGAVHDVAPGRVDELAAALRSAVHGELLVALGGGRIIDVAKALAAADPPRRVAAVPTTLSGAEMTAVHRHAAEVAPSTPRVRPAIVLTDPTLCASQPRPELASSAANALGHAAEGPLTPLGSPVPTLAALEAARLIVAGLFGGGPTAADRTAAERQRVALALGALLAGYVIGSTGYGLHHVVSQTLVRFADVPHGIANAVMLPHTLVALRRRAPEWIARFDAALDGDAERVAERICERTGVRRLRDAGVAEAQLLRCAAEAVGRPELHLTPPAADAAELRELYESAW